MHHEHLKCHIKTFQIIVYNSLYPEDISVEPVAITEVKN